MGQLHDTALATRVPQADRGIKVTGVADLMQLATMIQKSGLAPRGLTNAEAIAICIECGLELGMSPMKAMQSIAVINGRPCLWGDGMLGLVLNSGLFDDKQYKEWTEGVYGTDDHAAFCRVARIGGPAHVSKFSIADAKRANLWGKQGPWTQYPSRMLRMRARAFALRDVFADVIGGFHMAEELQGVRTISAIVEPAPEHDHQEPPPPAEPQQIIEDQPESAAQELEAELTPEQEAAVRTDIRQLIMAMCDIRPGTKVTAGQMVLLKQRCREITGYERPDDIHPDELILAHERTQAKHGEWKLALPEEVSGA